MEDAVTAVVLLDELGPQLRGGDRQGYGLGGVGGFQQCVEVSVFDLPRCPYALLMYSVLPTCRIPLFIQLHQYFLLFNAVNGKLKCHVITLLGSSVPLDAQATRVGLRQILHNSLHTLPRAAFEPHHEITTLRSGAGRMPLTPKGRFCF